MKEKHPDIEIHLPWCPARRGGNCLPQCGAVKEAQKERLDGGWRQSFRGTEGGRD